MILWNVDKTLIQKEEDGVVAKVSKLTNGYPIKVECNGVHMANLFLENGVLMYSFRYPPRMLSIHRHKTSESSLTKFCLRCYAYNDHLTVNFTKPRDNKFALNAHQQIIIGKTINNSLRCALNATGITAQCQINIPV